MRGINSKYKKIRPKKTCFELMRECNEAKKSMTPPPPGVLTICTKSKYQISISRFNLKRNVNTMGGVRFTFEGEGGFSSSLSLKKKVMFWY